MMPSPEMCVSRCLQASVGKFGFSPRVHASTHEPGNTRDLSNFPQFHKRAYPPRCDRFTTFPNSRCLGGRCALFPPSSTHTSSTHTKRSHERTETLVYRDLISCHPGRYVSDHKQARPGLKKFMLTVTLFAPVT